MSLASSFTLFDFCEDVINFHSSEEHDNCVKCNF